MNYSKLVSQVLDLLEYGLHSKGMYKLTHNIILEVETFWKCI